MRYICVICDKWVYSPSKINNLGSNICKSCLIEGKEDAINGCETDNLEYDINISKR